MATFLAEYRATVVAVFILVSFFGWMDVSLYYKLQTLQPAYRLDASTASVVTVPNSTHTPKRATLFSMFKGLSVKMAMMDQVNNYIFTPLAEIFNQVTDFSRTFSFISANMVSFMGLVCAFIAAKLVTYDSFAMHRLSVLVFQMRTFFDALDGVVAREHLGITKHVSVFFTSGFFIDATADSIGFLAYTIGCYIYLRRNPPKHRNNGHQYLPLQVQPGSPNVNKQSNASFIVTQYIPPKLVSTSRQVFFVVLCFVAQLSLSALFWNRNIKVYNKVLESPALTANQAKVQNEVLKSSIMWVLMWFWKLSNAHMLMQMLLLAVFLNRMWEFFTWIQYIGFVEILTLAAFTEIHINDVQSYISRFA